MHTCRIISGHVEENCIRRFIEEKKHHKRKDIIKQDEHGSTETCALYNTKQLSVLHYALHNNRTDQMLPDVSRVQSVKQLVSFRVTDTR